MKKGFTCGARGFIAGSFDFLHPGYIFMFQGAKKYCNHLVVGLHINPKIERRNKNKPIQTVLERYIQLDACKYVDEIIPYETNEDLKNLLRIGQIDIRFLGSDYQGREKDIIGLGIVPIKYLPRNHSYSTSRLRERIKK